jgi:alginate O-acetyltransferase complex protein AlgJ
MNKTIPSLLAALATAMAAQAADVAAIAEKALEQVPAGTIAYAGPDGWLYSRNELEHLAAGELAGGKVAEHSKAAQASAADPIPAMVAFNDGLAAMGIKLVVVPVPPKCAVVPFEGLEQGDAMVYLHPFYEELRAKGIDVLDLYGDFAASAAPVYCKQDAHWNPAGIRIAAKKIAAASGLPRGGAEFAGEDGTVAIAGDLMLSLDPAAQPTETLAITRYGGETIDESSPVLILGDSHVLVFSSGGDMLAENAGLAECLAAELGMPVDRIGVKGSASTVVRMNLFRKAARDPAWLAGKKVVVWCFSAREFTESTSGWVVVPVARK